MRLVIVSGFSGSGKSTALDALEDLGYYCVDNLPIALIESFAQQMSPANLMAKAAVGIDARNLNADMASFPQVLEHLRTLGLKLEVVFLDADDNILLKRFSETRRKHPLSSGNVSLAEAIAIERRLLEPVFEAADLYIDTSHTNVNKLRQMIRQRVEGPDSALSLMFQSFGFKHGVPLDVDFVFDVRCLPNPHWDPVLRPLTGRDAPIIEFLEQQPLVSEMFTEISSFLGRWLPRFEEENRMYMTVAVGCTGGQHRSVYLVEKLGGYFSERYRNVLTRHRELS